MLEAIKNLFAGLALLGTTGDRREYPPLDRKPFATSKKSLTADRLKIDQTISSTVRRMENDAKNYRSASI